MPAGPFSLIRKGPSCQLPMEEKKSRLGTCQLGPFLLGNVNCRGSIAPNEKPQKIREVAHGAPRWGLSPSNVWRVQGPCCMRSWRRAHCRGVGFAGPTHRKYTMFPYAPPICDYSSPSRVIIRMQIFVNHS